MDAPSSDDKRRTNKIGVKYDTFRAILGAKLGTAVAQYYGIVQDGLLNAQHLFRGLKRPLMRAEDMHGDQNVLIYSWRPQYDYLWIGSPYNGSPRPMNPPLGRVFVVLAVENKPPYENEIVASIEHWNWVQEGPSLKGAPIGCDQRYTKKLWSNS